MTEFLYALVIVFQVHTGAKFSVVVEHDRPIYDCRVAKDLYVGNPLVVEATCQLEDEQ